MAKNTNPRRRAMSSDELLVTAQGKVSEAIRLDLWDVRLTLNEVHALLHARRALWCNLIEPHPAHYELGTGPTGRCPGSS